MSEPEFWHTQKDLLERQLKFLTTDRWTITFLSGGHTLARPHSPVFPDKDCVALLSGGLDSLVGIVDLVDAGLTPLVTSQTVVGDKDKQAEFAAAVGGRLQHLQLNHAAQIPGVNERSQRARSLVFLAYGVLAGTVLARHQDQEEVTLHVCENGFISLNPPLTDARLGSLSTRTTHPVFLAMFQSLIDASGLRVRLHNPYQFKTKGEMLLECADQSFLVANAHKTTSCGRYARHNFRHCGRCVPCLIRRAAFVHWGTQDCTPYVYRNIGRDDAEHAAFDDVRSAAMAMAEVATEGMNRWLGCTLLSNLMDDITPYRDVLSRGTNELAHFLRAEGVK